MGLTDKELAALKKIVEFEDTVPKENWSGGWEWTQVGVHSSILNNLITKDAIVLTYNSNRFKRFKLTDEGRHMADMIADDFVAVQQDVDIDLSSSFSDIVGHEDIKELLTASLALDKPIHVLLWGPPAIAKTLFLYEIEKAAGEHSLWLMGSGASKLGMWDIISKKKPKILLVDELEKMKPEDMVGLLGLMEKGRIVKAKVNRNIDVTLKTWVIATANRIDRIPQELKSRFAVRKLDEYSAKEFVNVVRNVLQSYEDTSEEDSYEIAMKLAGRTHDVRDAIRVARLAKNMGVKRAIELLS